ncbi:MAG: sporulation integral membrane protein YtvI [Clostridiales bacterium GWF2_38_85]|nr:MAG: sporulation integral membrane protein YtvI [Clostridiales bacterium GWF2_38_85]HBL85459.1 sporulation integral membrane protein YtvI [Clostridiales bacterium]
MTLSEKNRKLLTGLCIGVLIAAACYVAVKYLLPVLYPFVIAYAVALILQPIINFLNKKAHVPKNLSVLLLVLAVVFVFGFIIYQIGDRIYYELQVLANNIKGFVDEMHNDSTKMDKLIEDIASKIPFIDVRDNLKNAWANIDEIIAGALSSFASQIADFETIMPAITKVATFIPKLLIDTIIIIISAFYFSNDFKKINGFFAAQMPEKVRKFARLVKAEFTSTTGKYLRAYALIILITFTELFVGFTIFGIRYALLIAFITAIIDVLPVLGTGTVLIPWSIYNMIIGNWFMAVGLIILYLLITIIRQVMEPRIVGAYIGLYPLVTLICMYAGLKLMGIFGLFLFPITIIILKNLNDAGVIHLWKMPPPDENAGKSKKKKISLSDFLHKKSNTNSTCDTVDNNKHDSDESL